MFHVPDAVPNSVTLRLTCPELFIILFTPLMRTLRPREGEGHFQSPVASKCEPKICALNCDNTLCSPLMSPKGKVAVTQDVARERDGRRKM